MRFLSDILIFFGAILLTFGTDLEIQTSGQSLNSVGGLLGAIASLIGVSLLTAGILNHYRLTRERVAAIAAGNAPVADRKKGA